MSFGGLETGTVESFDDAVGLGEVVTGDGRRFAFQCIEIADGTRTIRVGARVAFGVRSRFGRREAMAVTPVP
jgi:cold shock CspA family protein